MSGQHGMVQYGWTMAKPDWCDGCLVMDGQLEFLGAWARMETGEGDFIFQERIDLLYTAASS